MTIFFKYLKVIKKQTSFKLWQDQISVIDSQQMLDDMSFQNSRDP